jgi:N-methylhydantoinase A/oxoprolinase/acetone carboxylase beta subunit
VRKKIHVIACAVLAVDLKFRARQMGMDLEYRFLEAGLHNNPSMLQAKLQNAIDDISAGEDACRIVIGYGVCGKGTIGVRSRRIPLVIPKVHDCIALFLGGDKAYKDQFKTYPGTYYLSAGWCEEHTEPMSQRMRQTWFGSEKIHFDDLVKSHGRKTADTTFAFLNSWQKNYQRAAFIDTKAKQSPKYEAKAREMARAYGWAYATIQGSHELIGKMLTLETSTDEILVVPKEHVIAFDAIHSTLSANPIWSDKNGGKKGHEILVIPGEETENQPYIKIGLGIDAGGTYTDAVIYSLEDNTTICKAKSLTTKWDFTIGIGKALKKLDQDLLGSVELVALSTTLATNAIVENEGQTVGMLLMLPVGMRETIAYEPKAIIQGELDISGNERVAVDREQVLAVAEKMMNKHGVTAFAVSGYAGSINPVHELTVKEILREETGFFVSCGHELSDKLNFQTRAITAMLNARIIPRLANLLLDLEKVMAERSIQAPVVVVKGDGTLMSAEMAKERPVETILSGPSASVAGARHLTGIENAIIVDMGGTTTDTAALVDNQVSLNESGSNVGGHKTHVKALNIRTAGLGGDSQICYENGEFLIGPRRVAPVAWLNNAHPEATQTIAHMGRNLYRYATSTRKMQILLYTGAKKDLALTPLEETVLTALAARPMSIGELAACTPVPSEHSLPLLRLEENGMIQRCGLTPTDLLHITGKFVEWDTDIASVYAGMLAYLSGRELDEMVAHLLEKTTRMLTLELLKRQLDDEVDPDSLDTCPVCRTLVGNLMTGGSPHYHVGIKLKRPVIGIGAPIKHFLPDAVKPLETEAVLPEDADVANAIGAITSEVVIKKQLRLVPGEDGFVIEGLKGNRKIRDFDQADEYAKAELTRMIRELASKAGTSCNTVTLAIEDQMPQTASGDPIFIGRIIEGTLSGRPDRLTEKPF